MRGAEGREREVNEKFRGRRSRGGTRGCLPFITAGYPLMESSCPHLSTVLPQRHAVRRGNFCFANKKSFVHSAERDARRHSETTPPTCTRIIASSYLFYFILFYFFLTRHHFSMSQWLAFFIRLHCTAFIHVINIIKIPNSNSVYPMIKAV